MDVADACGACKSLANRIYRSTYDPHTDVYDDSTATTVPTSVSVRGGCPAFGNLAFGNVDGDNIDGDTASAACFVHRDAEEDS